MKKVLFLAAVSGIAVSVFGQSAPPNPSRIVDPGKKQQDPYPNMIYRGGKILPDVVSKIIFWGPSWTDPNFAADKITGLTTFYQGFSLSNYAKTSDEYTGTNGQVTPVLTHQGYIIDTSPGPPDDKGLTILAEVCKQITAGNIAPDPQGYGYYPVYLDLPKPSTSFHCGYHSSGTCGGKAVQFASFWNLDGNRCGDPLDTLTGHSQGLAALANVSAHELSEARTDPTSGGWFDSQGFENGDKCGSPTVINVPFVTFSNGSQWKVQGEWSNAAYTAGTGYANSSGQKGCVDGH